MQVTEKMNFHLKVPYGRYLHLLAFSVLVSGAVSLEQFGAFPMHTKVVEAPPVVKTDMKPLYDKLNLKVQALEKDYPIHLKQTADGLEVQINVGRVFLPGGAGFIDGQEAYITKMLKALDLGSEKVYVEVEGHTDTSKLGSTAWKYDDNWGLSVNRSARIAQILRANGVADSHIKVAGRGPAVAAAIERSVATERSMATRLLDRRIVLYISTKPFSSTEYQR